MVFNLFPAYYKGRKQKKLFDFLQNSHYYREINGKQIEDFPVINKEIFMKNFDRINTVGITSKDAFELAFKAETERDFSPMMHGVTIGLSTGTSGNRGIFLADEQERALWVASVLDRVIGFPFKKKKVAFFLRSNSNLYESVKSGRLQFNYFDITKEIESHIDRLNEIQPHILVAQPSLLMLLAEKIKQGALQIKPSKIISVAEVLSPEDRDYMTQLFNQPIHQVYQCTEGFLAASCSHGTLHFNEDLLLIEKKYVDDDKQRFHPVITDYYRRSQPIIRYELNDLIVLKPSCECGSKMMAIEMIEGRSDDILKFTTDEGKEVRIFPDFFRRAVVMADEHIIDYAIVQRKSTQLMLYIHASDHTSYDLAKNAVLELLQTYNVTNLDIQKLDQDPHIHGYKRRRVKYEVK